MDENNNGVTPGIIGIDQANDDANDAQSTTSAPDSGQLFDSSAFTGEKKEEEPIQSIVLNGGSDSASQPTAKAAKGNSFITKWQTWAITSGVILVAAIIAIVVVLIISDGRVKDANALASYDLISKDIDTDMASYNDALKKYVNELYSNSYSNDEIPDYVGNENYETMKSKCIGRFGVSQEDLNFVETRMSAFDLQRVGGSIVEAQERLSRISSAYRSAATSINQCHEDALEPFMNDFEYTLGEVSFPEGAKSGYSYVSLPVTLTYKGEGSVANINLTFSLVDKNGVEVTTRYASFDDVSYTKPMSQGQTSTSDIFKSYSSRYMVIDSEKDNFTTYKYELKSIRITKTREY